MVDEAVVHEECRVANRRRNISHDCAKAVVTVRMRAMDIVSYLAHYTKCTWW
jgi:hypothetical protein